MLNWSGESDNFVLFLTSGEMVSAFSH
jgi:hypothetical protein